MKASEIVNKYALGERNFQGANLRGLSFKGKDLSGADFSGADIRGTDFTDAILVGTIFRGAKAGLEKYWLISALFVIVCLFLSGISGIITIAAAVTIFVSIFVALVASKRTNIAQSALLTILLVLSIAGSISFILVVFILVLPLRINGKFDMFTASILPFTLSFFGLIFVSLFGTNTGLVTAAKYKTEAGLLPLLIAIAYELIKRSIVKTGGTSFHSATLVNANFQQANLRYTDFVQANLTHTIWFQAKNLNFARTMRTYLQNPTLVNLLVARETTDKNFDKHELRGVNLQGANLTDASFIGADLSEANLQDADLSRAKLVQTQLDQTDFTGATLTGAFIEDWGITHQTKFDGVRCEYVFMRLPTTENPDPWRKPDNRKEVFADGDFGDFIKPIVDTLDLYHNQNVDPRAIAVSFKQLAENNPNAEIEIVAMERRRADKFLIRAKTNETADKSQLSQEYFEIYNQNRALEQQNSNLLTAIAEKNNRIASLETAINLALQRPSFYAENCQNQGEKNMSGDRNINTGGGNYNEKIEGDYVQGNKGDTINQSGTFGIGVNKGNIQSGAKVGGIINEAQPQNLAEAAKEIQQLLEQLGETYPTDTTMGKMSIATEAIQQIDSNPQLTSRVLSALQAGGTSALDSFLDHPAASFVIGALEDWQQSKDGK